MRRRWQQQPKLVVARSAVPSVVVQRPMRQMSTAVGKGAAIHSGTTALEEDMKSLFKSMSGQWKGSLPQEEQLKTFEKFINELTIENQIK